MILILIFAEVLGELGVCVSLMNLDLMMHRRLVWTYRGSTHELQGESGC